MKHTIWLLLIGVVFCFAKCEKENPIDSNNNNIPGLPPATQTGANTFGCLVNGVPWVPQGNDGGTTNLSIDYDDGLDNGLFNVYAKRILSFPKPSTSIRFGILDSMNFKTLPIRLEISKTSKGYINYSIIDSCFLNPYESSTKASGEIIVTQHNKSKRFISGTFEATLIKEICDTIKITKGRFDLKF